MRQQEAVLTRATGGSFEAPGGSFGATGGSFEATGGSFGHQDDDDCFYYFNQKQFSTLTSGSM